MGAFPGPYLPQPVDVLGEYAKMVATRNLIQQGQFQQQMQPLQLQQEQNTVQQQQLAIKSQQAITQAFIDNSGDVGQTIIQARRAGALPDDLLKLQEHDLALKTQYGTYTKTQLQNTANQHDNLRGLIDPIVAETDPTKQAQLYAQTKRTILADPNAAIKYGITDPSQIPDYQSPQQIQLYDASLKGGKQAVDDELKAAQTYEAQQRGKQIEQQQALGGTPEMQDVRYTNLKAQQAQGQPLSAADAAFVTGYEQRKLLVPQFRVENRAGPQGTWQLAEDPKTGEPLQYNTVTGETRPAAIARPGTFQKTVEPAQQALNYAQTYGSSKNFTGPGDEALMEKFFELAKPSTGFRMSQPQIDLLKNAQGWMGSAQAKLRHATTGTWFGDAQRQQIISTMNDLAKAKGISAAGAGAGAAGGSNNWGAQFGGVQR
jgi:hypothetical protein